MPGLTLQARPARPSMVASISTQAHRFESIFTETHSHTISPAQNVLLRYAFSHVSMDERGKIWIKNLESGCLALIGGPTGHLNPPDVTDTEVEEFDWARVEARGDREEYQQRPAARYLAQFTDLARGCRSSLHYVYANPTIRDRCMHMLDGSLELSRYADCISAIWHIVMALKALGIVSLHQQFPRCGVYAYLHGSELLFTPNDIRIRGVRFNYHNECIQHHLAHNPQSNRIDGVNGQVNGQVNGSVSGQVNGRVNGVGNANGPQMVGGQASLQSNGQGTGQVNDRLDVNGVNGVNGTNGINGH